MHEPSIPPTVDHFTVTFCPLQRVCERCGTARGELVALTDDTLVGVACGTFCLPCSVEPYPLRFDSLEAAVRRVHEHCGHLGVDVRR